jgi:hypothetical protein
MDHPYWTCCCSRATVPDLATDLANALALDEGELKRDNAFALVDNVPLSSCAGGLVTPTQPGGFGSISSESSSLCLLPQPVRLGRDFPGGGAIVIGGPVQALD